MRPPRLETTCDLAHRADLSGSGPRTCPSKRQSDLTLFYLEVILNHNTMLSRCHTGISKPETYFLSAPVSSRNRLLSILHDKFFEDGPNKTSWNQFADWRQPGYAQLGSAQSRLEAY